MFLLQRYNVTRLMICCFFYLSYLYTRRKGFVQTFQCFQLFVQANLCDSTLLGAYILLPLCLKQEKRATKLVFECLMFDIQSSGNLDKFTHDKFKALTIHDTLISILIIVELETRITYLGQTNLIKSNRSFDWYDKCHILCLV